MSRPPLPPHNDFEHSYFPAPSKERPALDRLASSDESISTLSSSHSATTASSIASFGDFDMPRHPYAALSYDEPAVKDDGEDRLQTRLGGLALGDDSGRYPDARTGMAAPSFVIPPSSAVSPSAARHSSLPAIVTSATASRGLSAPSPVERPSPSVTGGRLTFTPEASPSASPLHQRNPAFPPKPPATSRASGHAAPASSMQPSSHHAPHQSRPSLSPRSSLPTSSLATGMSRSGSASSTSPTRATTARYSSPTSTRPSSAGGSSGAAPSAKSSRPWVFDSDASSICSGGSGSGVPSSSVYSSKKPAQLAPPQPEKRVMVNEDGTEEVVDEGGEVFKAPGDMEFFDHRPEPPGCSLSIDRSDPSQIILRVTLPRFSLDNVTVAMRRGHRVHIVADAYGEGGGHFEKLVSLGSDVSSTAPRAEFDGTTLRIYLQRRPSRPSSSASLSASAPAPFGTLLPGQLPPVSPTTSTFSSPDLSALDHARRPSIASSLASAWSTDSSSPAVSHPPLSPSLDAYRRNAFHAFPASAPSEFEPPPPPCTAHAGPPPEYLRHLPGANYPLHHGKRSKSLTVGPEGARAAAKAAKEELARRAQEEARYLPAEAMGGCKLPFRKTKDERSAARRASADDEGASSGNNSGSSSSRNSGSGGAPSCSSLSLASAGSSASELTSPDQSAGEEGGQLSPSLDRGGTIKASSRAASPLSPPAHSGPPHLGATTATTPPAPAASSMLPHPPASPVRPKLLGNNLTLRPLEGQTFLDGATAEHADVGDSAGRSEAGSDGGGATPRREERGMRFTAFSS
ncbi:hypothetical protein JCM10207_005419 [Rhodosporidiobolus poonsookiae]